jgi:hypothetical protein
MLCVVSAALFMMVALSLQLTLAGRERSPRHDLPGAAAAHATAVNQASPADRR